MTQTTSSLAVLTARLSWFLLNSQGGTSSYNLYLTKVTSLLNSCQLQPSNIVTALHYIFRVSAFSSYGYRKLLNRFATSLTESLTEGVSKEFSPESLTEGASEEFSPESLIAVENTYLTVTTALMISQKTLNDSCYTLKTWTELSGINRSVLLKCELSILQALDFKVDFALHDSFRLWKKWQTLCNQCCTKLGVAQTEVELTKRLPDTQDCIQRKRKSSFPCPLTPPSSSPLQVAEDFKKRRISYLPPAPVLQHPMSYTPQSMSPIWVPPNYCSIPDCRMPHQTALPFQFPAWDPMGVFCPPQMARQVPPPVNYHAYSR